MGVRVMREGRGFDDYEDMDEEDMLKCLKKCVKTVKKIVRYLNETDEGFGERIYDDGREYDDDDWDDDGMGMRRGVKNTGRYGGEYRRRRR
jgi:hypothetical protein